ncbi:Transcriptional repressor tup11-like protein [Cladobotryum mycophilum]|uniref:Transcriptional repressor tup11-like protein n=1 Tax=Cladobotryum mycophilum TaxID=491253 RepID=A0ABR0SQN7_9HYPO
MFTSVWDISTEEPRKLWEFGPKLFARWPAVFSQDSKYIASHAGESVNVWDLETGDCISASANGIQVARYEHPLMGLSAEREITALVFLGEEHHLAMGSCDGTIQIWHSSDDKIETVEARGSRILSMMMARIGDMKLLISSSKDGMVKFWNVNTRTCTCTLTNAEGMFQLVGHPTNSSIIYTNRRALDLDKLSFDDERHSERSITELYQGHGLSHDEAWVAKDGKNVPWLPPSIGFWVRRV